MVSDVLKQETFILLLLSVTGSQVTTVQSSVRTDCCKAVISHFKFLLNQFCAEENVHSNSTYRAAVIESGACFGL